MIRADALEAAVEEALLDAAGDVPMREKKTTPASDVSAELARADEAIGALAVQVTSGALSAAQYAQVAAGLITRRDHLAALAAPETVEWEPTGQTFAEFWAGLEDKGTWLRGAGIKAFAKRSEDHELPVPDPRGLLVRAVGRGITADIHLGDLAELRGLAATTESGKS